MKADCAVKTELSISVKEGKIHWMFSPFATHTHQATWFYMNLHCTTQPSTLSYQHIIKPSQTLPAFLFPVSCYLPFARQQQPQSAA